MVFLVTQSQPSRFAGRKNLSANTLRSLRTLREMKALFEIATIEKCQNINKPFWTSSSWGILRTGEVHDL